MSRTVMISNRDLARLRRAMAELEEKPAVVDDQKHLARLADELSRAAIVEPTDIPADAVTMNSRIRLHDLQTKAEMECTLVFPEQASLAEHRISILAPLGTAVIGYRVGDVIEFTVPAGNRRLRIVEILYQPEAAGDHHL